MPVKETNKVGILCDEDKTKEQLIEELKWYREHNQYLRKELSRVEDNNCRLTEELTNVKRALSYNCDALKTSVGWREYENEVK